LYKDGFWCTDESPQAQMRLLGAPSKSTTTLRANTLVYWKTLTLAAS